MVLLGDLRRRNLQPELMDSPALEPGRFVGSLVGLRRVNRATRSARILLPDLMAAAIAKQGAPLRVLDIACGGGDIAVLLWKKLRGRGLQVEIQGCDVNPLAVNHAGAHAATEGANVTFFRLNAIDDPIPSGFDVIMSSLFLHHLSDEEATAFVRKAADGAATMLLIHDLVRGPAGYLLAQIGVRALMCNGVCREDGPLSVEGAFTIREAMALAEAAGLQRCTVESRFPFRFLLKWQKS